VLKCYTNWHAYPRLVSLVHALPLPASLVPIVTLSHDFAACLDYDSSTSRGSHTSSPISPARGPSSPLATFDVFRNPCHRPIPPTHHPPSPVRGISGRPTALPLPHQGTHQSPWIESSPRCVGTFLCVSSCGARGRKSNHSHRLDHCWNGLD